MQWIEVEVSTTSQAADLVSELLMRHGAKGTQIIDRADIPTADDGTGFGELYGEELRENLPEEVCVKAWFSSPEDAVLAQSAIRSIQGMDAGQLTFVQQTVQDEDWAENWKQYYKPLRVGQRLVIRPVWEAFEAKDGDLVIDMDPGMAFGTGTHETTRLCMEMIEAHFAGGTALDVGTGSGILAIALARLGAQAVTAVDIDPIAVSAARENVARNLLSERIFVTQGDLAKEVQGQFDFICANILADIVILLAPAILPRLAKGGLFLASGIIKERRQDVMDALADLGLRLRTESAEGEWVALLFEVADA